MHWKVPSRQARRRRGGAVRVRPYLDSLPLFGQFQITYLSLKKRPRLLLSVPSMHDRSNRYLKFLSPSVASRNISPLVWVTQKAADLLVSPLLSHFVLVSIPGVNKVRPFLLPFFLTLTLSLSLRFHHAVANLTTWRKRGHWRAN